MSDDPNDPDAPLEPFPANFSVAPTTSPFPPLEPAAPADPPSDWNQGADAHDLPTRENRLVALGRFAFPPAEPLDDEGEAARARRWTSQAIAVAVVFLLIFNAGSLQNWSRQQPPGWTQATVEQLSDVWSERLALLGADQPGRGVREAWRAFQDWRFPGQDAPAQ